MKEKLIKFKSSEKMFKKILSFILMLSLLSLSMLTYARYKAQMISTIKGNIARFNFELINGIELEDGISNLTTTRNDNNSNVDSSIIAPDTHGQFEIGVDATNSDVSLAYEINLDIENKPRNLHFYKDYNDQTGYHYQLDTSDGKIRLTGFFDDYELNKRETKTIYWNWAYETGRTEQDILENDTNDEEDMDQITSINIVAKGYQVLNPKIRTSGGDIITLTKSNVTTYYGEKVEYIGDGETIENKQTYRLFYVDFENKYKDGAGTIYIKSDLNKTNRLPSDIYNYSDTVIDQLNPAWNIIDGIIDLKNEHASACLTSPSRWIKYKSDIANYAIATPSLEMYTDSFNQSFGTDYKYDCLRYGYRICTNDIDYDVDSPYFKLNRNKNGMYTSINEETNNFDKIWLSSPANWHDDGIIDVNLNYRLNFETNTYNYTQGYICPTVSIKSDSILQLN